MSEYVRKCPIFVVSRFRTWRCHLGKGWPIASGVIEGACRHFVKDRCEFSSMRWTQAGAENLLRLRAIAENDDGCRACRDIGMLIMPIVKPNAISGF